MLLNDAPPRKAWTAQTLPEACSCAAHENKSKDGGDSAAADKLHAEVSRSGVPGGM